MKLSVITPCFNAAQWLDQTIDSIRSQTYRDIEHIVVDGGSQDATIDIVKRYPDIKLIVGKDRNMYDALNKGFAQATGDVFAYLNADDMWFHDSVERAIAALSHNASVVGVYSDIEYIDSESKSLGVYRVPAGLDFSALSCRNFSLIPQPTAFWRREAHRECGGFDDSYRLAGDFDFFLKLAKQGELAHLGEPLARFRLLSTSLTIREAERTEAEVRRILDVHHVRRGGWRNLRALWMRFCMALRNLRGRSVRKASLVRPVVGS